MPPEAALSPGSMRELDAVAETSGDAEFVTCELLWVEGADSQETTSWLSEFPHSWIARTCVNHEQLTTLLAANTWQISQIHLFLSYYCCLCSLHFPQYHHKTMLQWDFYRLDILSDNKPIIPMAARILRLKNSKNSARQLCKFLMQISAIYLWNLKTWKNVYCSS